MAARSRTPRRPLADRTPATRSNDELSSSMINPNALGSAASMQVEVPMPMHAQRARARAHARSVRALTPYLCAPAPQA